MSDEGRVQQLLEELFDRDRTPEEVCARDPDLLPEVRARWARVRRVADQLDELFPGTDPRIVPGTGEGTIELPRIAGYEVEAVLGRGGMGVVFKARQLKPNRPVALKMLLAGGYVGTQERARFQREVEAAAALRHPNIVPIYEVGEHSGRPYFTMELVEGGTLSQQLARALPHPRRAAELVATLAATVQFAHKSGVIHRDLKPANILIAAPSGDGEPGAPKIADFGLARFVGAGPELTHTGARLGTPSYMAPEQALGKLTDIGPATDVYALGAILYAALTGRPPFDGESAVETERRVISEDPTPPSRINANVPRDLGTICLKCLHKNPARRYASAQDLADDLHRYLDGKPVLARPVGSAERAVKWVRRRPATTALLIAVALLVAAGGTGAWLFAAARTRQHQTDREVRGTLERARGKLDEAWTAADLGKLKDVVAEGERAADVARSGSASAPVRQEAEHFREDAVGRLERAEKDRALLEALLDVSAPLGADGRPRDDSSGIRISVQPSVDEQYAAAFRAWGLNVDGATEDDAVARLGAEPAVVVQEVVAALDGWALERRRLRRPEDTWRRLTRMAERLDRNDRHRRLRALLFGEAAPRAEGVAAAVGAASSWSVAWELTRGSNWRQLLEVKKEIDPRTEPVLTVALLAQAFAAVGDAANAEQVLVRAVTVRPDQALLLDMLGRLLEQQGPDRLGEAIGYFRAARGQRPYLGVALSKALLRAGRPDEAEEVSLELVRLRPNNHAMWFHRGLTLLGRQKHAEAEGAFRRALGSPPAFADVCNNLGNALARQGKHAEAEKVYRDAIAIQPDLGLAHYNLGCTLSDRQKYAEAEEAYRRAVELRPDLAEAHTNLGNMLYQRGRARESEAACRTAIGHKPGLAEAHNNLGSALGLQGRLAEAEESYRKAIELRPDFAATHSNLGGVLSRRGKLGEAEAECRKAIELKPDLAEAHSNLGAILWARGKPAEAEAECRKAVELKLDLAEAQLHLGTILQRGQKYAEAEPVLRRAIELLPDNADAHFFLGNALLNQRKYPEAEAVYRQTLSFLPNSAQVHANLGSALVEQRKYAEAEPVCRTAVRLGPLVREAHSVLGLALRGQEKFDEAATSFAWASQLVPKNGPDYDDLQRKINQCKRFAVLNPRLPGVLNGTETPARPAEYIEFVNFCHFKGLYAAAARLSRDAFAAHPDLAAPVPATVRYNAACAAALAGCGQGKDAATLDDAGRAAWRQQALDWLYEDLTEWREALDSRKPQAGAQARKWLRHWQLDEDFTGVRGGTIAKLPIGERPQWEMLWTEVETLLRRANDIK